MHNVMQLAAPGIAVGDWQEPVEHETWPGRYTITTNADDHYSRGARHLVTFRFGKSRAPTAKNFVVLSAPYVPSTLIQSAKLMLADREIEPLDILRLPDAWSHHYPGWTSSLLFAPEGVMRPSFFAAARKAA